MLPTKCMKSYHEYDPPMPMLGMKTTAGPKLLTIPAVASTPHELETGIDRTIFAEEISS